MALLKQMLALALTDPLVILAPLAIFGLIVVAALLVRKLLFDALNGWAEKTDSHLGVLLTETVRGPMLAWAVILAAHLAVENSSIPPKYLKHLPAVLQAIGVWSLTLALSRLAGNAVRVYGGAVAGVRAVTSLTQKVVQVGVFSVGLVWLLKVVFDINLTPILTTLGVGGIAVALALQDTLSNLFAGFYVSVSGLVHVGDYIKLGSGEEGYVADITWRCTTMRTMGNNLVVIPNNKLGQTIFTNFHLPDARMGISIFMNVAMDSDIDRVEAILLDEAVAAAGIVPGILSDPAPNVRFQPGPGDWCLGFQVNVQIAGYADHFLAQSEMRKRLFKRLMREGVIMPYPTRTVILEQTPRP